MRIPTLTVLKLTPEALDFLYSDMAQNIVDARRAGEPMTAEEMAPIISKVLARRGYINGRIDPVRLAAEVAALETP